MRFHILCTLYVIVVLAGCSTTHSEISSDYGFQRLQAPQKVLEPGTLITYEESGEGVTAITPVCWRHQAFPRMRQAPAVPDAQSELRREFGDWYSLDTAYLENLQAKFPEVEDIQLRLRNASVSQYSDAELYKGLSTRSQPCQDAIAAREDGGETVYTVMKVLNADVTYQVIGVDRNRMRGKLPQKILERLKTELGGSSVSTFNQTITGTTHQVAFQPDIIGIAPPFAEMESEQTIEAKSMSSAEPSTIQSEKSELISKSEETETQDELADFSKLPRLTTDERQTIIQKIAVLSSRTSDADRYEK